MANETLLENITMQTDAVSAKASKAFVEHGFALPLVYTEVATPGVTTHKFNKQGSLVAQTVAENGNFTIGAGYEYTETSASAALEKKVAAAMRTVEVTDRTPSTPGKLAEAGGVALGRLFDVDLTTLFASSTNSVTATTILTVDELFDARYTIESAVLGAYSGMLVGIFDYKGINEIRKELKDTAGAAYVAQVDLGPLLGRASNPMSKYQGQIAGIDLYQTSGLQTDSSDDVAGVWDPENGFAAALGGQGVIPESRFTGSQGMQNEDTFRAYWKVVAWNDTAACAVKSDT